MTNQRLNLAFRSADLFRLGAALVLALILWGSITAAQDPKREKTFSAVEVTVGEFPSALQVVSQIPPVGVLVTGPRSDINALNSTDVTASLDTNGITEPGTYDVPVNISVPGDVWKKQAKPARISIVVEHSTAKQIPINVVVTGNPGGAQQLGAADPAVSEVTVRGPQSAVNRVTKVSVPVQISDQTQDFTASFKAVAEDAAGQPISEVTITPESVLVTVQITARGKRLAVISQIVGEPAQGFDVVDRTFNPATVLVDGPSELVDTLISVSTEPIDVSGATDTFAKRVKLTGLPDGVKVVDPSDESVDVVVQIRQLGVRQPLPDQAIEAINLGAGLSAELTPNSLAVTVVAADATIATLKANDILVQVNLSGLSAGDYTLVPFVAVPANVTWISSDPASVHVVIREVSAISSPVVSPLATPLATVTPG